ncbi:capsular polysaccharide synthesis protein [Reichenbachiella carrageenanivorans]|uniref:Capsular polysaccharide synthesis protein n=1 Tax=Reichenbachiella carrageenanivorans TaxID=2979869 RepID=A0ABY6D3W3_9BACT|nr:capsular polysaccharide synthesis protein [Reichenbachiella carrageenanivorans]UXX80813.1 capsular polysaccharide synthesis protein [Reichenbachiella carrageenanivorans]
MNRTIYTFWEPRSNMTPYLSLCMDTWRQHTQGFEHIILDYSNLFEYIPEGSVNIDKVKHISLALQKDVIQATVLKYNGGIFIDADMIFTGDLNELLAPLTEYDVVTFSSHLAFMMAKPNAQLINEWYEEVTNRIDLLTVDMQVNWDYFGNQIVNKKLKNSKYKSLKLDKYISAFTPEINYYANIGSVMRMYDNFWFSTTISTSQVFFENQTIIALHNSWTPQWYKRLSKEEILNHPCLMSRTLKRLTTEGHPMVHKSETFFNLGVIKISWFVKVLLRKMGVN